jgi:hypothetical protein
MKLFALVAEQAKSSDGCRLLVGTRYTGVWEMYRDGEWRVTAGLPSGRITAISVGEPSFVSVLGEGVFASHDGGRQWSALEHGPQPRPGGVLPLAAYKGYPLATDGSGTLFHGTPEGLFTWSPREGWTGPIDVAGSPGFIDAVAAHRLQDERRLVFVAVRGHGVFRQENGGRFERVLEGGHGIRWIRFATGFPEVPRVIAAGPESLVMSADAGRHWTTVPLPVRESRRARMPSLQPANLTPP